MSISSYRDHPLHALVAQLVDLCERSELSDPVVADNEQYSFARDKVAAIARLLRTLLTRTPAVLASMSALSNLQANIQAPISEMSAFLQNKNGGHLVNAAAQCEQNLMPYLWALPQPWSSDKEPLFAEILETQAARSSEALRQLAEQRDGLASSIEEAASASESLKTRLAAMQDGAAKERAEASATVANLQKAFAEKEIERASAFDQALSQFKDTFAKANADAAATSSEKLIQLEEQREKAARIVQVVGNIGVTGNYQEIANNESKQANFWRWATVIIFGAGIGVALSTFVKFWNAEFSPDNIWSVLVRLLYAIAITAPAWYTARESARHRTNSDRARQSELELASIGPFIELMPDDKKIEIREALTKHYFGNRVEEHRVQTLLDPASIKELIELVKVARK